MNLNATLIAQLVVFFILAWFTMKFVWPPIVKALDERANKIADGLAAADKAKADLSLAEKKVVEELRKARESAGDVRSSAEKQASKLIDDARTDQPSAPGIARPAVEPERTAPRQQADRKQTSAARPSGPASPEELENLKRRYGFDRSLLEAYAIWLGVLPGPADWITVRLDKDGKAEAVILILDAQLAEYWDGTDNALKATVGRDLEKF
mgnify:CR=1 FL=1